MTELLTRLFIRDRDNVQDPAVRRQYGTLSGLCGICWNDYRISNGGKAECKGGTL